MHTFSTFHLIATGVLLTGQGISQADALGWRSGGGIGNEARTIRSEVFSVTEQRDLATLADLGGSRIRICVTAIVC